MTPFLYKYVNFYGIKRYLFIKRFKNEKNSLNGDKLYSQEIRIFTRLETRMVKQLIYT